MLDIKKALLQLSKGTRYGLVLSPVEVHTKHGTITRMQWVKPALNEKYSKEKHSWSERKKEIQKHIISQEKRNVIKENIGVIKDEKTSILVRLKRLNEIKDKYKNTEKEKIVNSLIEESNHYLQKINSKNRNFNEDDEFIEPIDMQYDKQIIDEYSNLYENQIKEVLSNEISIIDNKIKSLSAKKEEYESKYDEAGEGSREEADYYSKIDDIENEIEKLENKKEELEDEAYIRHETLVEDITEKINALREKTKEELETKFEEWFEPISDLITDYSTFGFDKEKPKTFKQFRLIKQLAEYYQYQSNLIDISRGESISEIKEKYKERKRKTTKQLKVVGNYLKKRNQREFEKQVLIQNKTGKNKIEKGNIVRIKADSVTGRNGSLAKIKKTNKDRIEVVYPDTEIEILPISSIQIAA